MEKFDFDNIYIAINEIREGRNLANFFQISHFLKPGKVLDAV
jgi:hypothetical protein